MTQLTTWTSAGPGTAAPRLVVPAYFHPSVRPDDWALLAALAARIATIVLNLADGPGDRPDPAFRPVLERLRASAVTVSGYVDTGYGARPAGQAADELGRYLDWYAVDGVFFDRVPAGPEHLEHYAALTGRARSLGATLVALNHGAHPVQGYADHADLLGTFEGPWGAYLELAVPRWVRSRPAGRFFHLLHSVPAGCFGDAYRLAARRNAGAAYVTDRAGNNPWDALPAGGLR